MAHLKMLSIGRKGGKKVGTKVTVHKHTKPLLDFFNLNSGIQALFIMRLAAGRSGSNNSLSFELALHPISNAVLANIYVAAIHG